MRILDIVYGSSDDRILSLREAILSGAGGGVRKLESSDESSGSSDDIEGACPFLICGEGGFPENLIAFRTDGIAPRAPTQPITDTPLSVSECIEFCEETVDDLDEDDLDFEDTYVSIFTINFPSLPLILSACTCSRACSSIIDNSCSDPENNFKNFMLAPANLFGEAGEDYQCPDIADICD